MTQAASSYSPVPITLLSFILLATVAGLVWQGSFKQSITQDSTSEINMPDTTPSAPPVAERRDHVVSHHSFTLEDPYAWLKDASYPTVDDQDILSYLEAENAWFEASMAPIKPLVETLFEELKSRRPAADNSVPFSYNGYTYQSRFAEGAQYRTWHRIPTSEADADQDSWPIFLDETALAEGHEYFRLGGWEISPNNELLAYSVDTDGSERYQLAIVDLTTGKTLPAPDAPTLGTPVWSADSTQLAYTVVAENWRPYQVWVHAVGNTDTADKLIYEEGDTGFFTGIDSSSSEQWLIISSGSHTTSESWVVPTADFSTPAQVISQRQDGLEYHVDHGPLGWTARSNHKHPNFGLFKASVNSTADAWEPLLEGHDELYLTNFALFADFIVSEEKIAGIDQVRIVPVANERLQIAQGHYIQFPEAAYNSGLGNNPEYATDFLRVTYTSMVTPSTVFDYPLATRQLETRKVQEIPGGYNAAEFVTTRLNAPARDGVRVPVSLVHHRSTPIDGSAPLYLYGYGAYGSETSPSFSPSRVSLLERGFVFAIAHIRGGDELGYHWYTSGKLMQRTNTFNDFVDVAKHLIEEKYARAGNIAIAGGSAGGELMGAVVNQAPELWGAVAAHVPFVDVLNTMLDDSLPLTPLEWPEWGNPITDPEAYAYIESYSPYDQLVAREYPPMLVTAGLNDPRVTYWEPAKYVAKLRHLKTDNNTLLLKTNMGAGHGGASGRFDALYELAEEYAFFIDELEVSPQP